MPIPLHQSAARKPEKPVWHRYIIWSLLAATGLALATAIKLYLVLFGSNIHLPSSEDKHLYIRHGSTIEKVADDLHQRGILSHPKEFLWVARKKKLDQNLVAGHYELHEGMSNFLLTRMIDLGRQTPVRMVFHNIRTIEQLAGTLARQLEADSTSLMNIFGDTALLRQYQQTKPTLPQLFIPNTYEVYWTISPQELLERMKRESDIFWDSSRVKKCSDLGFSKNQVMTLASIVDQETNKNSEKPVIAGVYINRLKSRMPLQADPTIKFAVGDFSLRRIKGEHLAIDSPYNTYKYAGLPPGPICLPSIASIDAVLNHDDHGYYYFCAKDDFSGYHVFARSYQEHLTNARRYQRALNANGIL